MYWKFTSQGKSDSVYVPPALGPAVKLAQAAWEQFLAAGAAISARNRRALLQTLERVKQTGRTAPSRRRRPRQ